MASNNSDYNSNIPQWKKELILRRRNFGRALTSAGGMVKLTVTCPSSLRPDTVHQSSSKQQQFCPFQLTTNCTTQQDFHPEFSVRNMRLLDTDLSSDLIVSGIKCNSDCVSDVKVKMVEEKPIKKPSYRSMEKQKDEKQLKAFCVKKINGKDEEYQSDSSEELQYGPGIVNKLKSKYLSMTLRDNQKHSCRPSLANLRRATSLENMLDDDSCRNQDKSHFVKKTYHSSTYKGAKISQHHAKYLGLTRGSESIKRARSMDTLLKNDSKTLQFSAKPVVNKTNISNGIITPSIINEDIIIVDNSSHTEEEKCNFNVEDKELPPPDVVKQTLKIFEPSNNVKPTVIDNQGKRNVNLKSANLNTAKINNVDKSVTKLGKPSLSPKPVLSPEKRLVRPKITSPKRVVPVVTPIKDRSKSSIPMSDKEKEIIKSPPRIPSSPVKSPPFKPSTNIFKIPTSPTNGPQPMIKGSQEKTPPSSPISSTIKGSPVPPTLTSPSHINNVDHINDDSIKFISKKAIDGIGKEGTSVTFSFNESPLPLNKSYLPNRNIVAQATNTTLISSQCERSPPPTPPADAVPMSPSKQVAVIRPVLANKVQNLTEEEIEKNLINTVKTIETRIIASSKNERETAFNNCGSEKTNLWDKKPWQSQNSMVFNFKSRDTVPDYIENDGLTQSKRTTRCNGNKDDIDGGSGDDDWEPPTICNIRFIGDNILINGKSSFRKQPKPHKLRIQFNDEATTMFEYPSEESLSEEILPSPSPVSTPPAIPIVGSSLSSYTPKSGTHDTFELGVTRTTPTTAQPQQSDAASTNVVQTNDAQEYLKPADTNSETTWSQENTSDILF